eukprot:CAMPEP_0206238932 /NCGR_PEP_ID=MMETSP0047_2-20121206/15092_1 /ASSEMBLY_ACC=CAM_ASM_000192 /TAXON_ID=195065 /ORGANISM="Chroomonas mesostigmatica_cf, Strain CCMP1168" /LENGTH=303 /DNA_ID=CAMNT_0053663527 /DNA_START=78 /DNA_END=989 /DNA_ORIENTATION=-
MASQARAGLAGASGGAAARRRGAAAPLTLLLTALLASPALSFSPGAPTPTLVRGGVRALHRVGLRPQLPKAAPRAPRRAEIKAMDWMDLSVFDEGLNQGYALFEFVGMRLPSAFFKELGTPHRTPTWMAFFLLSNIAFPIAGVKILLSRERANRKLAIFVFMVGFISTAFHWSQCSLGSGSPVTHTWCLVDTTFSCISGLAYLTHSWGTIRKRMMALFALGIFLLFDTSKFYTVTHSLWHICSAFVAYRLVKDRDMFLRSKGKKTPLLSSTGDAVHDVIEANVAIDEEGRPNQSSQNPSPKTS